MPSAEANEADGEGLDHRGPHPFDRIRDEDAKVGRPVALPCPSALALSLRLRERAFGNTSRLVFHASAPVGLSGVHRTTAERMAIKAIKCSVENPSGYYCTRSTM